VIAVIHGSNQGLNRSSVLKPAKCSRNLDLAAWSDCPNERFYCDRVANPTQSFRSDFSNILVCQLSDQRFDGAAIADLSQDPRGILLQPRVPFVKSQNQWLHRWFADIHQGPNDHTSATPIFPT
jgi:hypothetical protein